MILFGSFSKFFQDFHLCENRFVRLLPDLFKISNKISCQVIILFYLRNTSTGQSAMGSGVMNMIKTCKLNNCYQIDLN